MIKNVLKASLIKGKNGMLPGVGVSFAFMLATLGFGINVTIVIWFIALGIVQGFFISFGNEIVSGFLAANKLFKKYIIFRTLMVYVLSFVIFFSVAILFKKLNFNFFPNMQYIFYSSLGVGVASVMIGLSIEYSEEKEEKLRLEKENKELAVIEERNRIARELHDSVSQTLFGINLNLSTLDFIFEQDKNKAREMIKQLQDMVQEVQNEMRLMIYELRPVSFQEKGFFEAIENLVDLFRSRFNMNIHCSLLGDEELLGTKVQMALYRVIQEAINNIVKHASASRVKVALIVNKDIVELVIQDNGKGFDKNMVASGKNYGIKGIYERIEELNGKVIIDSTIGQGSSIQITI